MLIPEQAPRIDNCTNRYPGYEIDVLRLDIIHPIISGNKFFKLKYYLEQALKEGKKEVTTLGGPWSNHILATAAAAQACGLKSTGLIRGERPAHLSPMLQDALDYGMDLVFLSRSDYDEGHLPEIPSYNLLIPEGGMGEPGARGAAEIAAGINTENYDHILCAVGTGTMLAGLTMAAPGKTIGISVVNPNYDHHKNLASLIKPSLSLPPLLTQFSFSGYARKTPALLDFMNEWYETTGIPSDFVYTGKLFYAADQLINHQYFKPGTRLLLIHSGGLQGNRSLPAGSLIF